MKLEGLTRLAVAVEGNWLPPPTRRWSGVASATAPFVAVYLVGRGEAVAWRQSDRYEGREQHIELSLLANDAAHLNVEVSFGGALIHSDGRCIVPSANYVPEIVPAREFACGTIERFTRVDGVPVIDVSVLFIARQDVKSGRNNIWHLRPELAGRISDPQLHSMLTHGREGKLRL